LLAEQPPSRVGGHDDAGDVPPADDGAAAAISAPVAAAAVARRRTSRIQVGRSPLPGGVIAAPGCGCSRRNPPRGWDTRRTPQTPRRRPGPDRPPRPARPEPTAVQGATIRRMRALFSVVGGTSHAANVHRRTWNAGLVHLLAQAAAANNRRSAVVVGIVSHPSTVTPTIRQPPRPSQPPRSGVHD